MASKIEVEPSDLDVSDRTAEASSGGGKEDSDECSKILKEISPKSRLAMVLVAMKKGNADQPSKRKTRDEILELALGGSHKANDHCKLFPQLVKRGQIYKGSNGRGFYLSELGKRVAGKLSPQQEAT